MAFVQGSRMAVPKTALVRCPGYEADCHNNTKRDEYIATPKPRAGTALQLRDLARPGQFIAARRDGASKIFALTANENR